MKIEEFKRKHSKQIKAYMDALETVGKKRLAIKDELWRLGVMIEYPSLRENNSTDPYNTGSADKLSVEDMKRKYRDLKDKFEHHISFDPEYRAAYKALLTDLRDDAIRMQREAEQAEKEAHAKYEKTSAQLYNEYVDAKRERIRVNRELAEILFHKHARMQSASSANGGAGFNMYGDPLSSFAPDTPDQIDYRLKRIEKMDADAAKRGDTVEFSRKYDEEFAKQAPTFKTTSYPSITSRLLKRWNRENRMI